jgi:RNA polymerase sigma-70 factor (ECF subfamily)
MTVDIESLYGTFGPLVLRRCRRLLRDEQKAEDAMQDVFVEILRRKATLDDRAPASLLLKTATNVCLNRMRTRRRHPEDHADAVLLTLAGAGGGAMTEGRSLARRMLDRIFGDAPASTALIAVLHHIDGLTLDEVATEVGMSVSGVRKRLRTIKERLPVANDAAATMERGEAS